MTSTYVCPKGRRQATALAAMNVRAVIGTATLEYVAPLRHRPTRVRTAVGARFQPRDPAGRFVSYAKLREAINVDYAMTAFDYDLQDENRADHERFNRDDDHGAA